MLDRTGYFRVSEAGVISRTLRWADSPSTVAQPPLLCCMSPYEALFTRCWRGCPRTDDAHKTDDGEPKQTPLTAPTRRRPQRRQRGQRRQSRCCQRRFAHKSFIPINKNDISVYIYIHKHMSVESVHKYARFDAGE